MKIRFHIILLASLLLFTVSYAPVIYRVIANISPTGLVINDCGEEIPEKSSDETSRETDQDEDPFSFGQLMVISDTNTLAISKNERYSLGLLGYYPEIVSPPPQG
jgi:hypothetical protein